MFSQIGRLCFSLTAVAPAFGAAAIVAYSSHKSEKWAIAFAVSGVLCVFIAWLLLLHVKREVSVQQLDVEKVSQADQKVLEFLLAYLLPVFSATSLESMAGSISLTVYSLVIVSLVVIHGNVFQVNPVLSLFGYHFYMVTSDKGIDYLLMSKSTFHTATRTISFKAITDYVILDVTQSKHG